MPGPGRAELVYTASDGAEARETIFDFQGAGIIQGQHNTDASITSFAHACFQYALDTRQDLWFATKDTIPRNTITTLRISFRRFMTRSMTRNSKGGH